MISVIRRSSAARSKSDMLGYHSEGVEFEVKTMIFGLSQVKPPLIAPLNGYRSQSFFKA